MKNGYTREQEGESKIVTQRNKRQLVVKTNWKTALKLADYYITIKYSFSLQVFTFHLKGFFLFGPFGIIFLVGFDFDVLFYWIRLLKVSWRVQILANSKLVLDSYWLIDLHSFWRSKEFEIQSSHFYIIHVFFFYFSSYRGESTSTEDCILHG